MILKQHLKLFTFLSSGMTVAACAVKDKGNAKPGVEWVNQFRKLRLHTRGMS